MNIYTIKEEQINSFVNREIKKKMKMIGIIMGVIAFAMFLFFYSYRVHTIIMPPLLLIYAVVLVFVYFLSLVQIRSMGLKTAFIVSEEKVSVSLDKEKLSLVSQFMINRNEARSGERHDQSFPIHQIESTTIKQDEIIIKSFDYNLFNGNGKITIPKEIEHYKSVKQFILENSEKFKIVS